MSLCCCYSCWTGRWRKRFLSALSGARLAALVEEKRGREAQTQMEAPFWHNGLWGTNCFNWTMLLGGLPTLATCWRMHARKQSAPQTVSSGAHTVSSGPHTVSGAPSTTLCQRPSAAAWQSCAWESLQSPVPLLSTVAAMNFNLQMRPPHAQSLGVAAWHWLASLKRSSRARPAHLATS